MLDVIVRKDIEKPYLALLQLCLNEIPNSNVIFANSLKEGFKLSQSTFVSFLGNGAVSSNHYKDMLEFFNKYPKFKKLSMITTPVSDLILQRKVYSYELTDKDVHPVFKKGSSSPYAVQIGHLAGALIRRSSLDPVISNFTGNPLFDSYAVCAHFWMTGKMVYVNPNAMYIANNLDLKRVIEFKVDPWADNTIMQGVKATWKREVI